MFSIGTMHVLLLAAFGFICLVAGEVLIQKRRD